MYIEPSSEVKASNAWYEMSSVQGCRIIVIYWFNQIVDAI